MKYFSSVCFLIIAFLINPLWGCGDQTRPDFQFDEAQMADWTVGTWSGRLAYPSGGETDFQLVVERPTTTAAQQLRSQPLMRTRHQGLCGTRERDFIQSADACTQLDVSAMPVVGRLTTSDGRYDGAKLEGTAEAYGVTLDNLHFDIKSDDGVGLGIDCDETQSCDNGYVDEFAGGKRTNTAETSGLFSMSKQ